MSTRCPRRACQRRNARQMLTRIPMILRTSSIVAIPAFRITTRRGRQPRRVGVSTNCRLALAARAAAMLLICRILAETHGNRTHQAAARAELHRF